MSYTIEMLWQCSICQRLGNKGRARRCAGCGKNKNEQDREYFPDDVSEAAAIDGDNDGYDRKCPYCTALNDAGWKECSNCGAPKGDGGLSYKTRELSLTENADGTERSVSAREVSVRGSGAFDTSAPTESEAAGDDDRSGSIATRATVIAGIVLLLGAFVWWLFSPRYVEARVAALHWEHVVHVERYRVVNDEGWSAPGDAFEVKDLGQRVHHYDQVLDHYKTVHFTRRERCGETCRSVPVPRRCRSKGDGTADCSGGGSKRECSPKYCNKPDSRKEPVYRDEPRYATWRAWKAWRWRFDRDVRKAGVDAKPTWPTDAELKPPAALRDGEQERTSRSETYRVVFLDEKGDKYEHRAKTEREFVGLAQSKARKLRVTQLSFEVLP